MRSLFFGILIFFSIQNLYSKETGYKCQFVWKNSSESKTIKDVFVSDTKTVTISPSIQSTLSIKENSSTLDFKETFMNNKNDFLESNFSCDTSLGCHGFQEKMIKNEKTITDLSIIPGSSQVIGAISKRNLFSYKNTNNGFSYQYILYKNEKNETLGLNVTCEKKK